MICLTPLSTPSPLSASSSDEPKWACKGCTFLNTYKNSSCEICGTRSPSSSSLLGFDDLTDSGLESNNNSVGSVFFPLRRCSKRKAMEDDDVIEVDGGQHNLKQSAELDRQRDTFLRSEGFRVLRLWNSDVDQNLRGVLESILDAMKTPTPPRAPLYAVPSTSPPVSHAAESGANAPYGASQGSGGESHQNTPRLCRLGDLLGDWESEAAAIYEAKMSGRARGRS